ncbi:MAG TPA: dihydropteroate synthase, partial [Fervidobacterium sp.]|nr:dihydropteroate synthase [Fervidobacterium sp.]
MSELKLILKQILKDGHTAIMGIINITPDSFYSGSRVDEEHLLLRVEEMIRDGVEILDIGGESTKPGADAVSLEEELKRVIPAVKMIRTHFDIPIS